ncbi:SWI/SNF-related matrix-associated actin-dependent regulator of chromatin subfamily D member 1-like [Corticium candelabrum]|uniref:SWI/SNF-related matrix-associated actin-dependent regulator of chromatin subfamily D member 1-like n=1 Tax=Corticium candelabrum TaxID=121492 RepID=UPI002E261F0E|nr:SWI/SNF-related matrix-associated actin-dependent regulator of chromatin subfamily D member 1-like [Corticium candelabrum]
MSGQFQGRQVYFAGDLRSAVGGAMRPGVATQQVAAHPYARLTGSRARDRRGRVIVRPPAPPVQPRLADKELSHTIRDLVPESQAYVDLMRFERKVDSTIMRKRLEIQEALKRTPKKKGTLRISITHQFFLSQTMISPEEGVGGLESSWELKIEGRLLKDSTEPPTDSLTPEPKLSSFLKCLAIELDRDMYGPDKHLMEWRRSTHTQETDGFQVRRTGDQPVKCKAFLTLESQPPRYRLDARLGRLLGVHTDTRPGVVNALWTYVKTHKLQDPNECDHINCDASLQQIFAISRMKFCDIPHLLQGLLHPPDPVVINHLISNDAYDRPRVACYDIEVDVDSSIKQNMNSFLLSAASQQEIALLETKIQDIIQAINKSKTKREFFRRFAQSPLGFIHQWLISQNKDLKTMKDVTGCSEEERQGEYYNMPWAQEAVYRYFYSKVQQKRGELEKALGIHNN